MPTSRTWYGLVPISTAVVLWGMAARAQSPPVNTYMIGNWDGLSVTYADCWAEGDYAYMGRYNPNGFANGATIYIFNIANPSAPSLVATYTPPPPNSSRSAQDVVVHDGLMYVSLEHDGYVTGAQIVDVRNPAAPQLLTNINIPTYGVVHDLFYDSGFLYLSDSRTPRFCVVDLTAYDPDQPPASITSAQWIVTGVGTAFVHDVTVKNGRLYASAWNGIRVYDVSNVATQAPTFLGAAAGQNTHSSWVTDDGQWIVTAEERAGGPAKLYEVVVDNGTGVLLTLRDTFALPATETNSVHDPRIIGDRVYCSWYQAGLIVLKINRINKMLESVGRYDTSTQPTTGFAGAWGSFPFLGANRLLISDMQTGLWVLGMLGDGDGDGDVDLADVAALANCFGSSGVMPESPCRFADYDGDGDVDPGDYGLFQPNLMGP